MDFSPVKRHPRANKCQLQESRKEECSRPASPHANSLENGGTNGPIAHLLKVFTYLPTRQYNSPPELVLLIGQFVCGSVILDGPSLGQQLKPFQKRSGWANNN